MTDSSTIISEELENAEDVEKTLERAEALRAGVEETEERPDWLPEGFDTVEEFLADYNALKGTPDAADAGGEEAEEGAEEQEEEATDDDVEEEGDEGEAPEGIDFDALTTEFSETGELSEDTIAALEANGIPRATVEAHMAGLHAMAQLTRQQVASQVGGEDNLDALLRWAGDNLKESEIERINTLVATGDFEGYTLALEGVKARYEANYGSMKTESLQGSVNSTADVYASAEEMKADMRSPRYAKDEAFRAQVAAKLTRSRRAGSL